MMTMMRIVGNDGDACYETRQLCHSNKTNTTTPPPIKAVPVEVSHQGGSREVVGSRVEDS